MHHGIAQCANFQEEVKTLIFLKRVKMKNHYLGLIQHMAEFSYIIHKSNEF